MPFLVFHHQVNEPFCCCLSGSRSTLRGRWLRFPSALLSAVHHLIFHRNKIQVNELFCCCLSGSRSTLRQRWLRCGARLTCSPSPCSSQTPWTSSRQTRSQTGRSSLEGMAKSFFLIFSSWRYIYISFQRQEKVKKKSQNSRNQGFSYFIRLLLEGSGSRSRSGSVQNNDGFRSGRSKTYCTYPDPDPLHCLEDYLGYFLPSIPNMSLSPGYSMSSFWLTFNVHRSYGTYRIGVTYGITRLCSFANDRQQFIRQQTEAVVNMLWMNVCGLIGFWIFLDIYYFAFIKRLSIIVGQNLNLS